jgi:hypothetical protein
MPAWRPNLRGRLQGLLDKFLRKDRFVMRFLRWLARWRTPEPVDIAETVDTPARRLIVYLRSKEEQSETYTAELDFWDVKDFERQLAAFRQQRKTRDKYRHGVLYEFKNRKGDVLAFTEERYVRHRVIDLRARAR